MNVTPSVRRRGSSWGWSEDEARGDNRVHSEAVRRPRRSGVKAWSRRDDKPLRESPAECVAECFAAKQPPGQSQGDAQVRDRHDGRRLRHSCGTDNRGVLMAGRHGVRHGVIDSDAARTECPMTWPIVISAAIGRKEGAR